MTFDLTLRQMPAINDFGAMVTWPNRPLLGRCAVVTRSSAGVGFGIASALAAQGAHVMLNGSASLEEAEPVRASLAAEHRVVVRYSPGGVADPDQAQTLVERACAEFGGVDILVNCPGMEHGAPVDRLVPELWDAVLALNLSSSFYMIRAALPGMKSRNWGRIVNIASAWGLVGMPGNAAYVAAHHGLVGLTKAVALECALSGVTCNAICPGSVITTSVRKKMGDLAKHEGLTAAESKKRLLAGKQPSAEFVTPWQIGAAAAMLCSSAGAEIRGGVLSVDGGLTAA